MPVWTLLAGWMTTMGSDGTHLSITRPGRRSPSNCISNSLLQPRLCAKQPPGSNSSCGKAQDHITAGPPFQRWRGRGHSPFPTTRRGPNSLTHPQQVARGLIIESAGRFDHGVGEDWLRDKRNTWSSSISIIAEFHATELSTQCWLVAQ